MWTETCGSEGERGSEGRERGCGGRRVGVRVRGGVRDMRGDVEGDVWE